MKAPNCTLIPNEILDSLPEFTDGELRVIIAIAANQFCPKKTAKIDVARLTAVTGLSTAEVDTAMQTLCQRGYLNEK